MNSLNTYIKSTIACLSLFLIGLVFKYLHWPGGLFFFTFGGLGFSILLFLTVLSIDFNRLSKDDQDKFNKDDEGEMDN